MFAAVLFAILVSSNAAVPDSAFLADDACLGGQECSLELRQLRGEVKEGEEDKKVNVEEATALQDATAEEDDEEDEGNVEEDAEEDEEYEEDADIENVGDLNPGKRCFHSKDKQMFKAGAKDWFTSGHRCMRECTFTKHCITTCMMKHGYSKGCSSCTGLVVRCAHDRCGHICLLNSEEPTKQCQACAKKKCGQLMKDCSGRDLVGEDPRGK
eukprot:TRINITY_DN7719_c0_g1_i1.p1 TRINITY_DN7719_c0_g1~~TRINITY_DN7719_c0_g1_i1.p1  ORF type:complete len:243 (+),score=65.02 TRINITY_DN7719_c0_g1_i1:95-730(+)